jgi:hypothetical protein
VAVPGGRHRDSGHEVEEPVAVHVLDHGTLAARHDQGVLLDVAALGPLFVPADDVLGSRTGRRNDDLGIVAHDDLVTDVV